MKPKTEKEFSKKDIRLSENEIRNQNVFFQKQKIENNFSKSENRKLTCMQSNIKNRFWKSESEIEIQNCKFGEIKNQKSFFKI